MGTNDLYRERARLIALLTLTYPAVIAYTDKDNPDWPVIYVMGPTGQLSWHLAERDLDLFPHVPTVRSTHPCAQWDGHTDEEKFERMEAAAHWHLQGPNPSWTD